MRKVPADESGAAARQCVPDSGSCEDEPLPETCEDDNLEDNDTRTTAKPLTSGDHVLTSCPAEGGDDEDWFSLNVTTAGQITLQLLGGEEPVLVVGDDDRRAGAREAPEAQCRVLQERALGDERQELLGQEPARHRPQARARAAAEKDGNEGEGVLHPAAIQAISSKRTANRS